MLVRDVDVLAERGNWMPTTGGLGKKGVRADGRVVFQRAKQVG